MHDTVATYVAGIAKKYAHENNSEYGYRTEFETMIKELFAHINVDRIDHDAATRDGNKPDFVLHKDKVPVLYVEVKDIGKNLDNVEKSDQMQRYFGYRNLVLSDYCEFRFYRDGVRYGEPIRIATPAAGQRMLTPHPEHYEALARTLLDFSEGAREPIRSGAHLAKIMGGKARRIRDNVRHFFTKESEKNEELSRLFAALKRMLVSDMDTDSFADMYAQTLVYGLFTARYHDETPDTFSRSEARDLVPASNPFLREFFDHITGSRFDTRLTHIVDELCEVFVHTDTKALVEQYVGDADPVIHFYEDFLREYDPVLRKNMGAYYTPTQVVRYIVRGIDELLVREFGVQEGLADTQKLRDGTTHRVQVLDPAVGTGTFVSAVIRRIYERMVAGGQTSRWQKYVHHELLPRIHGFELMMTPYTIAHLKLSVAFRQTGFHYFNKRLGIYLTNTLAEQPPQADMFTLGVADQIAREAQEAERIKRDTPIMVVLGNPPYSGESNNAFCTNTDVYKTEPGGMQKLQEKNSKWLRDDYVKFVRFAEEMVEKHGEGVVGMITPHGYIDNPTFRGMRWHLRNTFDAIYVLDLHGNANKKETTPSGGKDENVFDIKTGTAIIFAIKKQGSGKEKKLAQVYHSECYGTRKEKFAMLDAGSIAKTQWAALPDAADAWKPEGRGKKKYMEGVSVAELFPENSVGIVTSRDHFVIDENKQKLTQRIQHFLEMPPTRAQQEFGLRENQKWTVAEAQKHVFDEDTIVRVAYRPFDIRWLYYSDDMIERSRKKTMQHFVGKENVGMMFARQVKAGDAWQHVFISESVVESSFVSNKTSEIGYIAPLYLYTPDGERVPNIDPVQRERFTALVGEHTPEYLLDYVYATLHSPSYRKTYAEFLQSDFPRVPLPKSKEQFFARATIGTALREAHLHPERLAPVCGVLTEGSDVVEKVTYTDGKVYINAEQYFPDVPEQAWHHYIGGYQPAQKWLKDRKGSTLSYADGEHYRHIIASLATTIALMQRIDVA
jgi:predicted helicase